jgi:uncharacterized membrane protein YvlD (DUF360 family)
MKRLLARWLLLTVSVYVSSLVCNAFGFHFVVNARSVTGIITLLIGVAVWGLLNATLGKILKILTGGQRGDSASRGRTGSWFCHC